MSTVALRRRFERGEATAAEIEDVAREVVGELRDPDSEASRDARAAGLDPAVSTGAKVAETLWKEVIWPRVRRRLGVRALGAEKDADQEG